MAEGAGGERAGAELPDAGPGADSGNVSQSQSRASGLGEAEDEDASEASLSATAAAYSACLLADRSLFSEQVGAGPGLRTAPGHSGAGPGLPVAPGHRTGAAQLSGAGHAPGLGQDRDSTGGASLAERSREREKPWDSCRTVCSPTRVSARWSCL